VEAADQDPVTGLLNHRAIHQRLKIEFELALANGSPLSIIMMDLNDFKFFNDTYGHPTGDKVLQSVARTLHSVRREDDILGRYGGDEFIAILPNTDGAGGRCFAERVRTRMAQNGFTRDGGSTAEVSVPIVLACGVASFPNDSDNYQELITVGGCELVSGKTISGGY
jgi:diguanylate cyclase (GGDEF)-like protein